MRELDEDDMKRLSNGFLKSLNEYVNGDESKCIGSTEIFNAIGFTAYSPDVIPTIVQELIYQGLIRDCETEGQVRITRKGRNRLERTIDSNVELILQTLVNLPKVGIGSVSVDGRKLQELTDLTPAEINDAIEVLEEAGFVSTKNGVPVHPFNFYQVKLTPRGKYEYVRQFREQPLEVSEDRKVSEGKRVSLPPTPVGSPFGFTDIDWEVVLERKKNREKLFVVFGYKFESEYYNTTELVNNIHKMFEDTIREYNKSIDSPDIDLVFKELSAGYGQHLFNEIARDIISSDIAVFDASDLNPNVMIEIGVALTWGVRTLPIRAKGSPTLPSDISGQTWAEYSKNGSEFLLGHAERLLSMIELAIRKKRGCRYCYLQS